MRKWTVRGADANTGADRDIVVTAQDEAGAMNAARYNGVLGSDVCAFTAEDVDARKRAAAAKAQVAAAVASRQAAEASKFADVPGSAWRLRAADFVISIIALLYISVGILGVIFVALCVAGKLTDPGPQVLTVVIIYSSAAVGLGVVLWGVGAALRMLASIGLATTQVAQQQPQK